MSPTPPSWPRSTDDDPRRVNSATTDAPFFTDLRNAERLVELHGADLRYVPQWGSWLRYDGRRWARDVTGEVMRRARETILEHHRQALELDDPKERQRLVKELVKAESDHRLRGMIRQAESVAGVPVEPHELDCDPMVLNVANGTLDLRIGELRPHDRGDLITKLAAVEYNPEAQAPTWTAFLDRVLAPDAELVTFLQRMVGYCLTGSVAEQVLVFLHGLGANGKTTFLNALLELFGDFGRQADPELLLARHGEAHPTSVADLHGARLVVCVEVEEGRRLAEVLVKQLTGGDRLKARFMRQDFFEFAPTFKVLLGANHKPVVRGTDEAIWRRIRLVPFTVTIPEHERDAGLAARLRDELPGILRWAVEGCLEWQRQGLGVPAGVREATEAYREQMDVLGSFLTDRCVLDEGRWVMADQLRRAYETWCDDNGERAVSQKAFGMRLSERGLVRRRQGKARRHAWFGIDLADSLWDANDEEADPSGRTGTHSPVTPITRGRSADNPKIGSASVHGSALGGREGVL